MINDNCRQKIDGLTVSDSITEEELQNLVRFFAILLDIDERAKDAAGDSKPEVVPQQDVLK